MDFRFTLKEEALRKEFDDYFREAMKNAPPEWETALEPMVSMDVCAAFHRQMAKKLEQRAGSPGLGPGNTVGRMLPL